MTDTGFHYSEDDLRQLAQDALAKAKSQGASAAEVTFGESFGLDVCVRAGKPESVVYGQELKAEVAVYLGQKMGEAGSNSFAGADVDTMVERALAIARQMSDDDCNGLPEPETLASGTGADLDQYHPWRPSVDEALRIATEMAQASWEVDQRVSKDKSEGSNVSSHESRGALANSHGFVSSSTKSHASLSCEALAELEEGMETAHWYDVKLAADDLESAVSIGRRAGERVVSRAGTRPIKSAKVPVLFETGAAHSLVRSLMGGIGGNAVYRKLTYLADKLGEQVCAKHLTVSEDPLLPKGMASAHHDDEGVRTQAKDIIQAGVLNSYLLSTYTGRKLGRPSTGNSGGTHNLSVSYREMDLDGLLKEMGRGLFVTGTMGAGANFVTGNYSAGAFGFWVEDGAIAFPVKDATIAGDLREIYTGIVAGGNDWLIRGATRCGSLLVAEMAVGGG